MTNTYYGILTTNNGEFMIYSNGEDVNLTKEFEIFYMKDIPLHIKISNSKRVLCSEYGEFYKDRNNKRIYNYHINDINIEKILSNALNDLVEIVIEADSEVVEYAEAK